VGPVARGEDCADLTELARVRAACVLVLLSPKNSGLRVRIRFRRFAFRLGHDRGAYRFARLRRAYACAPTCVFGVG